MLQSRLLRFWAPDGHPIALAQFALFVREPFTSDAHYMSGGSRWAVARMNLRQSAPGRPARDTTWNQGVNGTPSQPGDLFAAGFVSVPLMPGMTSWSLAATFNPSVASSGGECVPLEPLPTGSIVVSDLAFGLARSDLAWQFSGQTVLLSATGEFARNEPIHVTYQVRSDTRHDGGRTTITLTNVSDPKKGERLMQVRFDGVIGEGVNVVERELDVSHLKSGKYLVELEVADKHGGGSFWQSGMFTLK